MCHALEIFRPGRLFVSRRWLGHDRRKMSKSLCNSVVPLVAPDPYGADVQRYTDREIFCGDDGMNLRGL
jgi:valyl-tRNA synthetase